MKMPNKGGINNFFRQSKSKRGMRGFNRRRVGDWSNPGLIHKINSAEESFWK
jgi:hypothetical protein